jgi:hypothetical protein
MKASSPVKKTKVVTAQRSDMTKNGERWFPAHDGEVL